MYLSTFDVISEFQGIFNTSIMVVVEKKYRILYMGKDSEKTKIEQLSHKLGSMHFENSDSDQLFFSLYKTETPPMKH